MARNQIGGSITTGGTAQTLSVATNIRNGFAVQNLHASADLWVMVNGGAAVADQPSFKIPAGALYESAPNERVDGLISIIGGTTGQKFAAWEW